MANNPEEITIRTLEILGKAALCAADIFDIFASGKFTYKFSRTKEEHAKAHKRSRTRSQEMANAIDSLRERQRLHILLHSLEKQGLITKGGEKRRFVFSITEKGAAKCRAWKKAASGSLHQRAKKIDAPTRYEMKPSPHPIILSFDIPEREKNKRIWLRSALRNLEFKMLHRSVWIGENMLPKELVREISRLRMQRYVHVFSVIRKGTIK